MFESLYDQIFLQLETPKDEITKEDKTSQKDESLQGKK